MRHWGWDGEQTRNIIAKRLGALVGDGVGMGMGWWVGVGDGGEGMEVLVFGWIGDGGG